MSDTCLVLLTKMDVEGFIDPIEKLWDIDNWVNSLDRVMDVKVNRCDKEFQHFILTFDAGREFPDRVEVERVRTENGIHVIHLKPPPGILSLSAMWWLSPDSRNVLYARRSMTMLESDYSKQKAKNMFFMLKENINNLMEKVDA